MVKILKIVKLVQACVWGVGFEPLPSENEESSESCEGGLALLLECGLCTTSEKL